MEKSEILDYIQNRASGRNQSSEFTLEGFFNEMVELVHKEKSQIPEKISRPKELVKHTQGEWTITGETANMIIVKAIHQNGKRTVAKIPFTTEAQDENFGMTDHYNAKLIKNAPKLKQIAEMYFDDLSNNPNSGSFLKGLISGVLTDINQ